MIGIFRIKRGAHRTVEKSDTENDRYRQIFESAGEAILVGMGGFIRLANRKAEELTGYTREELGRRSLYDFIHPDDRERVFQIGVKALSGEPVPGNYTYRGICKDGTVKWVESNTVVIEWEGQPAGLNFVTEITDQKILEKKMASTLESLKSRVKDRTEKLTRADEAVRLSEKRFKALFENAPLAGLIFRIGRHGFVLSDFNRAALVQTRGWIAGRVGRRATDIFNDRPDIVDLLRRCRNEKATQRLEADLHLPEPESRRHIRYYASFIPPEDILVYMEDITEQHRIEAALQESEVRYRRLVEHSPLAICITIDDRIVFANQTAATFAGLADSKDLIGLSPLDMHPAERRDSSLERRDMVIEQGAIAPAIDYEFRQPDGEIIVVQTSAYPYLFEGKPAVLILGLDVTEQKKAREALAESEAHLRALMRTAEDFVIFRLLLGRTGMPKVAFVSPSARTILKASDPDSFSAWLDAIHPEDRPHCRQAVDSIHENGKFSVECRTKPIDGGDCRWLQMIGVKVDDAKGFPLHVNGVILDITERKNAENYRLAHRKKLQDLAIRLTTVEEDERRRLAVNLHESLGQLLALGLSRLKSLREQTLKREAQLPLSNVIGHLEESIQAIRAMTFELSPPLLYDLGLAPALEWLAEYFQDQYGPTIRFYHTGQGEHMPARLKSMLFRSVRELLNNAVQHAKADRIDIELKVEDGYVEICVSDNGVGMDMSSSCETLGNGFGLFSIKERFEPFGGELTIDSSPGQGSMFTLKVPSNVLMVSAPEA